MASEPVDLDRLVERLREIGCVAAEEEAHELLEAAGSAEQLEGFLRRRATGEPLAWITGSLDFGGQRVFVDPGVYVPRFESLELARRASAAAEDADRRDGSPVRIVDLCTGSGAIASVLMRAAPAATVIGIDLDLRAVRCARRNGVATLVADVTRPLPLRTGAFDVVAVVAPYVPRDQLAFLPADVQRHEPRLALDGGIDGLDLLRRLLPSVATLLRPGGRLFAELGEDQDRRLGPDLGKNGFEVEGAWHDEEGDLRGLAARTTAGRRQDEPR